MQSNTIKLALTCYPNVEIEGIAAANLRPGMNLHLLPNGEYVPHPNIGDFSMPWVAVEEPYTGSYKKDLDDLDYYPVGERVYIVVPRPGDVLWMWLNENNVAVIGNYLISSGNGYLNETNTPPATAGAIVGVAREAVTTGGGEYKRIKVEIAK